MVRGLYSAAAGVFTQQKALNSISNNIANTGTAGYKSQSTLESSFGEHFLSRISDLAGVSQNNIGSGNFMTINSSEYTDFTQGFFDQTDRSVDMAIQGKGFFLVESEAHGRVLTRNGQFEIDGDGNLYLPGVGKVLNDGGSVINLESSNFAVGSNGTILVDGEETDLLYIADFSENTTLKSVGSGVFQMNEGGGYRQAEEGSYHVMQGMLEKSNVNMAREMSRMIASQNQYNSCTQIIKMYDKINELTVNQIGSVG